MTEYVTSKFMQVIKGLAITSGVKAFKTLKAIASRICVPAVTATMQNNDGKQRLVTTCILYAS